MTTPATLIARLLGPAGPELSCEQCFDTLDVFVELEVVAGPEAARAAHPAMAVHLLGCPACDEDRDSLRSYLEVGGATE